MRSVKLDTLDEKTRKRLKDTALMWARLPHPRVRQEAIQLGLRWGCKEFVAPALELLESGDDEAARSAAYALRNYKAFTAEEIARIKQRVLA